MCAKRICNLSILTNITIRGCNNQDSSANLKELFKKIIPCIMANCLVGLQVLTAILLKIPGTYSVLLDEQFLIDQRIMVPSQSS